MCNLNPSTERCVFQRDWTTCSTFANYSRFNSQHNWGDLYYHLIEKRILSLTMNKIHHHNLLLLNHKLFCYSLRYEWAPKTPVPIRLDYFSQNKDTILGSIVEAIGIWEGRTDVNITEKSNRHVKFVLFYPWHLNSNPRTWNDNLHDSQLLTRLGYSWSNSQANSMVNSVWSWKCSQ